MIDRICLTLAKGICPVTQKSRPKIMNVTPFKRPEKRWKGEEGEYVEYVRSESNITWSTNLDIKFMLQQFKINHHPPLPAILDYGAEIMDVFSAGESLKLNALSRYTISDMPNDMFFWLFEMVNGDFDIFRQFVHFVLNEKHEEIGMLTGSRAFAVLQTDKLRDVLDGDNRLAKEVENAAGIYASVHAVRWAFSLPEKTKRILLVRSVTRNEMPRLPLFMSDEQAAGFIKAARIVLLRSKL